jgi:hypothetical protein
MSSTGYYVDPGSDDVTFLNMRAGIFTLVGGTNISIRGGEVGPWTTNSGGEDPQVQAASGYPPVNILIEGVYFHDIQKGSPSDHTECLQFGAGQNVVIRNNRFVRCADHDIFIRSWGRFDADKIANFTIENNFFAKPTVGYYAGQFADAADFRKCENMILRNNTLAQLWSVTCSPGSASAAAAQIYGNLWALAFDSYQCNNGSVWRYNYFESANAKCHSTDTIGDGDANFVNRAAYDYHLTAASDARGKADPTRFPATDIDGNSRSGMTPDAGADQAS